jgi:hypothetical protein
MAAIIWVLHCQLLKLDLSADNLHNKDIVALSCGSKLLEYLLFGFLPCFLNFPKVLLLLNSIFCGDCIQTCSKLPLLDSLEPFFLPCVLICNVDAVIVHVGYLFFQSSLDLCNLHRF